MTTSEQINAMLDFLNEHKGHARGHLRSADGRLQAKRVWEELTQLLNFMGDSIKTVKQWQKVWTDKKHLAKKTAAIVRRDVTGTGGGPPNATLSLIDMRVQEIMGVGFGEPQTTARVPAFPSLNIYEEVRDNTEQEDPSLQSRTLATPLFTQNAEQPMDSQPPIPARPPSTHNAEQFIVPPVQPTAADPSIPRSILPRSSRNPLRLRMQRRGVAEENVQKRLFRFEQEKISIARENLKMKQKLSPNLLG